MVLYAAMYHRKPVRTDETGFVVRTPMGEHNLPHISSINRVVKLLRFPLHTSIAPPEVGGATERPGAVP